MNHTPEILPKLIAALTLLSLLAGCANMETIRLVEDRPEDLNALLERQQYERAEQLLNQYPYLDTPEQRRTLHETIADYEDTAIREARSQEREDDLIGAVAVLDNALTNLPHSTVLNEYRRTLEQIRDRRLRDSVRRQLISRAEFIVEQQEIYTEQLNLEHPGLGKRWTNTYYQHEAASLAGQLLSCGLECLQENDLETAESCLRLARAIDDTPVARAAYDRLNERLDDNRDAQEKQAHSTRVKQEKKLAITRRNHTDELLEQTGKALDANDLLLARVTFEKIPGRERGTASVVAMQKRLDKAIAPRVTGLQKQGDRQYRTDRVDKAINSWQQALELDPDNTAIQERLERANRVLARLQELKSLQQQ
jgi:tetratricopeptide (TPR) repeat protein